MKINYQEISKSGEAKSEIFFLKNRNLWFFLSPKIKSRYFGGFLFFEGQVLRFLDDINFNEEIVEGHILSPKEIILYLKNNQVYLKLAEKSLELTFASWQNLTLTFDIKEIFKNEPQRRKIFLQRISSSCLIVDEFLEGNGRVKILISADSPLEIKENWVLKRMSFDEKRNSPPENWFVYNGLLGKVREIKIEILEPKIDEEERGFIFQEEKKPFINFLLNRVQSLILANYLPAGFPWFYENWFRDELLSLYLLQGVLKEDFLEERFKFYLSNLESLWNKNKPFSNLETADTFLFLILNLDESSFSTHFSILEKHLAFWKERFIKNNEFDLPPYSTWMDTLDRKSALEIETLYLKALRKFARLNKFYVEEANYRKTKLIEKIKKSKGDLNLAFCFLFLEDLFSLNEWSQFFDDLIEENYLDWGGFSTLSKNDPNFKDEDDGEKARAYHSGDSWYFLNNLTAFCLAKIDFKKYKNLISQIIQASLEELFFDGALGFSSEISSAKERKSEGCLVQFWSMASLIYFFLKSEYQPQIFEQLS